MEPKFPKSFKVESKPHKFCPGCGYGLILRGLGYVIDELNLQKEMVMMTDIGCNLLAWDYFDIPTCQTHHGRTVPTAVGFKIARPETPIVCLAGDGGAYAIGLQNLLNACLRDSPITVIIANNLDYSMTGGQVSPTSLDGQVTDSTPAGKDNDIQGETLFGPELLKKLANPEAFIARTSSFKYLEIQSFLKKAFETQKNGHFSLVEVISACPLNWGTNAQKTIEKVQELEKIFPQGEIK